MPRYHFETRPMPEIVARIKYSKGDRQARAAMSRFTLFDDLQEAADYLIGKNGNSAYLKKCARGAPEKVSAIDRFVRQYEDAVMPSPGKAWTSDVAGALPNVQAHIAGLPLTMRNKRKRAKTNAPLAILVDLSGSSGIGHDGNSLKGAAILALVSILSASRPIELWAGANFAASTQSGDRDERDHGAVYARINTSPIDMSVASHIFCDNNSVHELFYPLNMIENRALGGWAFGDTHIETKMQRELLTPAFPHVEECLAIPAALYGEIISTNPIAWLDEQIKRYSPSLDD